ncbi:hypothetical protein [Rubellicoccus peritrichatus]|uniref:Tetratricopeptide repeat protein n=1 Tax=Rubellicoccus peritrichatus TaxID=3080537 RepID=A0AAQ3LD79_9BACT|nr:hypothetical protein [Puniceicoccus sp. CR14]WOO43227.1 hypothetical protein RZN69_09010 [Puniceicoccus sp. CR14]
MKIVLRRARKKSSRTKWHHFWRIFSISKGHHAHSSAIFFDVHLGRLFLNLGFLLVFGYIFGALALSIYWGRHEHSKIGFMDVLLPNRWSQIRPMQGQMLIANADAMLEDAQKDPQLGRVAFHLYRSGLRMYPQDHHARLMLARFFVSAQMYEQAAEVLAEGLDYGMPEDKAYVPALLEIIQLRGNHPLSVKVIPKLLEFETYAENPKTKYPLYRQLMLSQLQGEDYIGLLKTAETINADEDSPFKAHDMIVTALSRMGSVDEALDHLNDLPDAIKRTPAILLLKASVLNEAGEKTEMMAQLQSLFRDFPQAWNAQINAIMLMIKADEGRQANAYITLFLNNHSQNYKAISNLAVRLTDLPDSERIKTMLEFCKTRRPELVSSMEFFYIQALTTEGNFEEAVKQFNAWSAKLPDNYEDQHYEEVFGKILKAVTQRGQDTRLALIESLESRKWEAEIFWEAARALHDNGQFEEATQVLNIALNTYPYHPSIISLRDTVIEDQEAAKSESLSIDTIDSRESLDALSERNTSSSKDNLYDIGITEKDLEE